MTERPSVLPLLAAIAVSIAGRMASPRDPPPPPDTRTPIKAAWIGVLGSVVGASIAGAIAVWALSPAYKQTEAAQRQAAVSTGQILRARFKAANEEWKILANGNRLDALNSTLALEPQDVGRMAWLARHSDREALIRDSFIPYLDNLVDELIEGSSTIDLPDLERSSYVSAIYKLRDILHTVLDGRVRENGSIGRELPDGEWRAHVDAAAKYAWRDWMRARLLYNHRINIAIQVLRQQIAESDRLAMGEDAARVFRVLQQNKIPIDDDWPAPPASAAPSKP